MNKLFVGALLCAVASATFAADNPESAKVQSLIKQRMHFQADSVRKLPVGLYEVVVQGQVVYVDPAVKFFINGPIIDIQNGRNLTQERLDELAQIDVTKLPLDQALKTVRGNGKRVIYTFSDPYCGYCQRLERTLAKLDNVTIYSFVVPLMNSEEMVNRIFCSKDPTQAWHDWMIKQIEPAKSDSCQSPLVQKNALLVSRFGINSAPNSYFSDGSRLEGAVSLEDIEKKFSSIYR